MSFGRLLSHIFDPINAEDLVRLLKVQIDENLDKNCTPFGICGSYGAPFKLTYTAYNIWLYSRWEGNDCGTLEGNSSESPRVPQYLFFLGTIDLALIYFHDAGDFSHMLVMGWGGESIVNMELTSSLRQEIHRLKKEIRELRNDELNRALIIDFHRSKLDPRPVSKRSRPAKRKSNRTESPDGNDGKRSRVL
ncbi:hypothetical protein N7453_011649 [Penicillium expansum]|nr:hypothetical protein N7453_011649 [Penicillium expansum]